MESVADVMNTLIARLLKENGECPHCQSPLYSWRNKRSDGRERCQPTCMTCGYTDLKRKEDLDSARIYNESLKNRAVSFFRNGSIVTNESLFEKKLSNYITENEETKKALETVKSYVNDVLLGKPVHLIINGKSGTGKSHLSMGACWEVVNRSNYDKKCLFINYRELLEQMKFSFVDEQARKALQGNLIADIKTTDLVVIDDLGAELGGGTSKSATTYNNDVLHSILEAREERALILNTNLSAQEIREAYGERVLSRILNNSKGHVVTFKETKDKRMAK